MEAFIFEKYQKTPSLHYSHMMQSYYSLHHTRIKQFCNQCITYTDAYHFSHPYESIIRSPLTNRQYKSSEFQLHINYEIYL